MENIHKSIRNYIESKHRSGINPIIKNVADLRICKDQKLKCADLINIINKLGFKLNREKNTPDYQVEVKTYNFNK
ncbi:hypothetical protein OAA62_00815 [bacterium]|nr:hypothetical protein [bacterium]